MFSREGLGLLHFQASKDRVLHISNSVSNSIFNIHARTMDSTAVGGELVEYSKKQLFWAFPFLSAAVWTHFLKQTY